MREQIATIIREEVSQAVLNAIIENGGHTQKLIDYEMIDKTKIAYVLPKAAVLRLMGIKARRYKNSGRISGDVAGFKKYTDIRYIVEEAAWSTFMTKDASGEVITKLNK